jgi:ketosteroid isomerase-like protein
MSQQDVETVRRFFEAGLRSLAAYYANPRSSVVALEAGELDRATEAVLAFLHPDIELNALASTLYGGTVRGHLGWLRVWDELLEAGWQVSGLDEDLEDLGDGHVLATGKVKWGGRQMELEERRAYMYTVRDGLIVRIDGFRDRREALEAAGLSGQDAHSDS